MTEVFKTKVGDTAKAIRCLILPASRDLTGATVAFHMRSLGGANKTSAPALIVTATVTPTVEYSWLAADLDTAGEYEADFTVTYVSGKSETFPESGYVRVTIAERAT